MSEGDIQVILHRLNEMDDRLCLIHEEVRRTNGRVTELEMQEARWQAKEESKRMQNMIISTVLSGTILAGVIYFISHNV